MDSRFKPPKAFFKYLKSEYAYSRYGNEGIKLSSELQSHLLCASYGVTAWIRTKKGACWCFRIHGIEEIEPHYAFGYSYISQHGETERINPQASISIFRQAKKGSVDIYKSAMDIAKKVVYTEGWELPSDDMIKAAISAYRAWISTGAGFDWVKSLFRPIMEVTVHDGLAYKITSENQTFWIGGNRISSEPKPATPCMNCDIEYPCTTNLKGIGNLCNRCYGENFGEMDVLSLCNRHECAEYCCENYMSDGKLEDVLFGKYGAIG